MEVHGAGLRDNTLKGVARAYVDSGMGDCDVGIRWKFKMPRLEVLASSGDQRRLGPPEEGAIGTEFGREGLTVFIAQVQPKQSIEQTQHARSVRTSSAQTGSHGNDLVQVSGHAANAITFLDEVVGSTDQVGHGVAVDGEAGEVQIQSIRLRSVYFEDIVPADRPESALQVVEPIRSFAGHEKAQIDFGGSKSNHAIYSRYPRRLSLRSSSRQSLSTLT